MTKDAIPYDLVDAVFTFIAFMTNSLAHGPTHGHTLVGAGFLPVFLDVLKTRCDRRDNVGVVLPSVLICSTFHVHAG